MSMEKPSYILRGQMYYACLDPVLGSEQGGHRPVLIIQNNAANRHSPTVIAAPITSQAKMMRLPTHIGIPPYFGLPKMSVALLEQIRTIDKSRLGDYIGCLDDEIMDYIDKAISFSVGLVDDPMPARQPEEEPNEAPDEMVLCLCPTCARQFFNSSEHIIRRLDPLTTAKELCTYCDVRMGYTYRIIHKKKRLGGDRP